MKHSVHRGFGILGSAIVLGIVTDLLLKDAGWGINVLLAATMLLGIVLVLMLRSGRSFPKYGAWLAAAALLAASGYALRDSATLLGLDFLALGTTLLLAAAYGPEGRSLWQGVFDYLAAIFMSGISVLFGCGPLLYREIPWGDLAHSPEKSRSVVAIARGIFFSIPPLIIFGALLSSADPVFAHYLAVPFQWDMTDFGMHFLWVLVGSWLAGGYLRRLLPAQYTSSLERIVSSRETEPTMTIGSVEIGIVLGALDALFFAFVLIQLRYFFGGRETVLATVGMTYAVYARQGFFELVTVASLVLPLLLSLHTFRPRQNPAQEKMFSILAGIMVLLLFVIMASALGRMSLYRSEYGLTELRVYTTAFMFWLAAVFAWFAVTVLRGQRRYFALGSLVAGFTAILLLHGFDPDAKIVQANTTLARTGHSFDACYATSLSADAVPALITALPSLSAADQKTVAARLLQDWQAPKHQDWRAWNWDRSQAWKDVQHHREFLQTLSKGAENNKNLCVPEDID